MRHLDRDRKLALIESAGEPDDLHLRTCARCRAEVENGRAVLGDARLIEVPEPSPLFWDHLSARVSEQVAAEPEAPRRSRLVWRVLVPSAVGIVAILFAVWIERGTVPPHATPASPLAAAPSAETVAATLGDDEPWLMLGEMAGEFDVDTLSDSLGTSQAAGAEDAVYELSAGERANLAELLRSEMGQPPAAERPAG
jgi:hypothetical protein